VKVVCQDARTFRLEDHESDLVDLSGPTRAPIASYFADNISGAGGADLITLSYSLSMIVSQKFKSTSLTSAYPDSPTSIQSLTLSHPFFPHLVSLGSLISMSNQLST
jgi:hypothetical protein